MMDNVRRSYGFAILTTIALATGAVSCEPEQLDAAFLYIPAPATAPGGATAAGALVGVRVVVDSLSLGFYPLPAEVPVLSTGTRTVRVEPAVRRSGLGQEVVVYPLFAPVVNTLALVPGVTDTLQLTLGYATTSTVGLEEDFERPTDILELDLVREGSAPLSRQREGAMASGHITLTAEQPIYEVASAVVELDRDGFLDLWVELDYRGETALAVGLFPRDPAPLPDDTSPAVRYFQGALPREDWTRLYFDIVDASNADFLEDGFRVSLLAVYDEAAGGTQDIFIDNLRVVYR